jgi:hypothetical protein
MPEEYDNKDDDCGKVRCFEEFVTHSPSNVSYESYMCR